MRTRFLLAVPVLLLGFVALWFAATASPTRDAQNDPLVRALAHPPKSAAPATTRFLKASRKIERAGFIRRRGTTVTAKGWVSVITPSHGKDGRKSGDYRYQLHARGKSIELHVDGRKKSGLVRVADAEDGMAFAPGQVVQVAGRPRAGGIAVERAQLAGARPLSPAIGPVSTERTDVVGRKVAVLRFYKPGQESKLVSNATLQQTLVDAPNSVQKYFARLSNDKLAFTFFFQDFPAKALPATTACEAMGDFDTLASFQQSVEADAQARGDSLDNYDHIINIGALDSSCPWGGNGESYFRNSTFQNMGTAGPGLREVAHELGHNLGLAHGNALVATKRGAPVSISTTRSKVEYGDSGDVMGGGSSGAGLSGPQLARLGLLPVNRIKDLTPADYGQPIAVGTVDNALAADAGPRMLRIRRATVKDPRAVDAYLYIDLRQNDSRGIFEQFAPNNPIVNGVSVRVGPSIGTGSMGWLPYSVHILNSSPGRGATRTADSNGNFTGSWLLGNERKVNNDPTGRTKVMGSQDFAVAVGQSMYDPIEDLTISTESIVGGQATVKVTAGPPPGNPTTVAVSGKRLNVQAGAGRRNNVVLAEYEGQVTVVDVGNRVQAGAGCTRVDDQTASCSKTPIASASVTLDATTDTGISDLGAVYGDLKLPISWNGGDGQDSLEGGPGDDTFSAGPGGSAGSDADLITGGGGKDRIVYSGRSSSDPIVVRSDNSAFADGGASEGDQISDDVSGVTGGAGNDQIKLNAALAQSVNGGPGTDTIFGGTQDDTIVTRDGAGGDQISCGGGADKIFRDETDTIDGSCPTSPPTPQIAISGGPENGSVTNATSVSFTFYALWGMGISYTCKLESGTVPGTAVAGPCTDTADTSGTYTPPTPLAEGDKVFTVTGTIGSVTTTESRTFRVDRTAPTVSIDGAPSGTTDASGSNFAFGFSDPGGSAKARFECSLDSGTTWTSCSASTHYPDLAPGNYHLVVRAVDEAGNLSATQAYDWTVVYDTILDSAEDWQVDRGQRFTSERPAFQFHATGTGAVFWCSIDAPESWIPCSSVDAPWRPATALNLNVEHTIKIAAGNASGPTDPTPLQFVSDAGKVPATINTKFTSAGPPDGSWVNTTSVAFGFEAFWTEYWHGRDTNVPIEVTKFECRLVNSTHTSANLWFPCSTGFNLSGIVAPGNNTFSVRAVRDDGQRLDEDWTPAKRTFKVDTVAPTVSFGSPSPSQNGWIAGPDTAFGFTASESAATFECRLDSAPTWQVCSPPQAVPGLTSATHSYDVRATDQAGNVGPVATRTFDVGIPHATFTDGPPAGSYTNSATPTFKFTATHSSASFECAIGLSSTPTYTPCETPWTVPAQAAGSTMFRVRAKLPSGQLDSSFAGRLVYFDYTAPVASIDSPALPSPVTTDDVSFAFSAPAETQPTFECKLDTGGWEACTSPKTVAGLTNASHTWSVHAIDRAGNISAAQSRTFTVNKPKVLTIGDPAPLTPSAVSLTAETPSKPAIDWVHWKGNTPTQLDRKAGVNKISTWSVLMGTQPNSVFTGATNYSWTDAAGTASGSSAVGVATGVANGRGFRFTVPSTNATTRTLKLYVGLRGVGVSDAIRVSFSDGVQQAVSLTSTSDSATARTYTVTFRPTKATDTLTVDWFQGGGATKSTALAILYGAALY